MRKATTVIQWPNKLGFDVGNDAEVWVLENGLEVCIFTKDGRIRYLLI